MQISFNSSNLANFVKQKGKKFWIINLKRNFRLNDISIQKIPNRKIPKVIGTLIHIINKNNIINLYINRCVGIN